MPFKIAKKFLPTKQPSFKVLQEEAEKIGVRIIGNEGEGKIEGFGVRGAYSISQDEIVITITDKPFLIPEMLITNKIQSWLDAFEL